MLWQRYGWVWFKSGLKIPTKMYWVSQKCVKLGLLSLQFDSVSVYIAPSPKMGGRDPYLFGNVQKNTWSRVSGELCTRFYVCACVGVRMITRHYMRSRVRALDHKFGMWSSALYALTCSSWVIFMLFWGCFLGFSGLPNTFSISVLSKSASNFIKCNSSLTRWIPDWWVAHFEQWSLRMSYLSLW